MKRILYLILKAGDVATSTLEEARKRGYNGTLVSTESLRHALEYHPEEHTFFTLRHYEQKESLDVSMMCLFVVDSEKLEELKNIIRDCTDHFRKCHGFFFSKEIEDYEGSV